MRVCVWRSGALLLLALLASAWTAPDVVWAAGRVQPAFSALFEKHGVTGCFVLLDERTGTMQASDDACAGERAIPASTFKIANSLIALETGVIADEEEIVPYGGKPQRIKAWQKDMSIRDAIRVSNVPVFQTLARRIGIARYRDWLKRLSYGNGEVGESVDTFWLRGPLVISPAEQVAFLDLLAREKLPSSPRSQRIVADILKIETGEDWSLHAKTGWALRPGPDIGWWVGWVRKTDQVQSFALRIDMQSRADVDKREPLGQDLLKAAGVLP